MLALVRLVLPETAVADARALLTALSARTGFVHGRLARSLDEPQRWALVTEWADVGSYRRALSAYDTKIAFAPVMGYVVDEPTGYEVVVHAPESAR